MAGSPAAATMHSGEVDTRSVRRNIGLGIALVFALTLVAAGVVTAWFWKWPPPLATFPATALIGFSVVGLSPLLIVLARESVEYQRRISRIVLACGLLLLLWLDAAFVLLSFGVERDVWWLGYAATAAFLSALLVGVAPYGRRARVGLLGRLVAIWVWAAVLPWIPWNHHKRMAMDGRRIRGTTVETVQEVMGDYYVYELWADGAWVESRKASHHERWRERDPDSYFDHFLPWGSSGGCSCWAKTFLDDDTRVRDLDLRAIDPDSMTLVPGLQGCRVDMEEGVVVAVSFPVD